MDAPPHYELTYLVASDEGLDQRMLRARSERELDSLQTWERTKTRLTTMAELRHWLFMEHGAYTLADDAPVVAEEDLGPEQTQGQMPKELQASY